MTFLLCIVSLVASTYLSIACFFIIQRMTKRTAWSLALAVIAVAALGAYGFLESLAYLAGLVGEVSPLVSAACVVTAIVFLNIPRIRAESEHVRH